MSVNITRRSLAGLAVATLAIGLAGCGSGGGDGDQPSAGNKILNVFTGSSAGATANFNPFSQTAVAGTLGMIYEPLMFFNGARSNDIQPQLATAFDFADAGRTLNLTIRDGVKWSDGQAFSAEDVVFTFNLIKGNEKLNTGGLPLVEATAADATHATLKFSRSMYTEVGNIVGKTWIVPKHLWQSVPDPSAYTNEKPVGTGAFKLANFAPQNYVLERNPNYWEAGKPKIQGLRYRAFSGNESGAAALANGELDWAGMFMPDVEKQFVSRDPKHNKYLNESSLYVTNLVPNHAKAPYNDVAVRKAISAALDRDQIIKLAFAGYGKYPSVSYLPLPTYADHVKPEYASQKLEFNPQAAGQLLEQAGYAKGADGIYAKAGQRLSITCKVVAGFTDYISALQIITEALKKAGIEFKAQEVSYTAFASAQQTGDFDMIITNAYGGIGAYSWYSNMFATKNTAPIGKIANANYSRFSDPAVDAALEKIAATDPKDVAAIKQEIMNIQDLVIKQLPYIPLQQSASLAQFRTVNATGWPTEDNHYALALPFNGIDSGIVAKNLVPVG